MRRDRGAPNHEDALLCRRWVASRRGLRPRFGRTLIRNGGQSHNVAARHSARVRSFAVEAFVRHRVTGWPFARFDISISERRIRLSFPWFTTRSRQATAIRAVIVTRRFGNMYWIGFAAAAGGGLGDVHVHAICRKQMIDELRRCGYHVVGDTGTGAQAPRWPRRRSQQATGEPFFRKNAARWADALRDAGADVVMTERPGSHGGAFWQAELPLMVAWAFGH